ncbi:hypothetical protein [Peribacillus kribbensis]|uniref:hypothetical protein n=1 Tax=Peribacillus kribbensis TaxID=356658 RepID=UPI000426CBF2|nr:hypothetical protein [Peribacillus kribbensis]
MFKTSSHEKTSYLVLFFDITSLLFLLIGFLQIFLDWPSLLYSDAKRFLTLPIIGAVFWISFTLVESSLLLVVFNNKEKYMKFNKIMVNLVKNGIVICFIIFNLHNIAGILS